MIFLVGKDRLYSWDGHLVVSVTSVECEDVCWIAGCVGLLDSEQNVNSSM